MNIDNMKTLRRCRTNIERDNVVLIDVDTYNYNNVIIIDVPESLTKKRGGSTDKSRPKRTYIYIDDDESPSDNDADAPVNNGRNFDNGASSSRRYVPDVSPVKLSKGKRTYSGRGFNGQSENDSSDDDDSHDCEFMEDFNGKLREEWERASLKRKGVLHNEFRINADKQENVHVSNFRANHHENIGESSSGNVKHRKENLSDFRSGDKVDDVDVDKDGSHVGETHTYEDERMVENDECVPSSSTEEENEKNDNEDGANVEDDDDDDVPVQSLIIGEREKLKETEEYKRALEEELKARERQIKIQAEEAQHLRRLQKRKNAETQRLLDMERRQKQRVEEIRETQKKDEENMNLKERYRTEVIQELKKLEIMCVDMASLLRGLGIRVGDGLVPSSNEVRAAYKRALLSFHPDRASGSDMRQQVEAEEKFKLISRMKEKLSL
ncbi:uncharacterized protein [Rutidosis leptorrhynchoides]|uniref:uncharacterized protein n=1 Tax=Rutidosis leptorrhynchoides TaxID=125765 RepID=UPI003A99FE10